MLIFSRQLLSFEVDVRDHSWITNFANVTLSFPRNCTDSFFTKLSTTLALRVFLTDLSKFKSCCLMMLRRATNDAKRRRFSSRSLFKTLVFFPLLNNVCQRVRETNLCVVSEYKAVRQIGPNTTGDQVG